MTSATHELEQARLCVEALQHRTQRSPGHETQQPTLVAAGVQHLSKLVAAEEGVLDLPSLELKRLYTTMAELYDKRAEQLQSGQSTQRPLLVLAVWTVQAAQGHSSDATPRS